MKNNYEDIKIKAPAKSKQKLNSRQILDQYLEDDDLEDDSDVFYVKSSESDKENLNG